MSEVDVKEDVQTAALVVRYQSTLAETNYEAWRAEAMAVLEAMNLSPATAEEFGVAKEVAKKCKDAEDNIAKTVASILAQNTEVDRIVNGALAVKAQFGLARTTLTTAANLFVAKQKEALIVAAMSKVKAACAVSPVSFAVRVDEAAIRNSIKRKSAEDVIKDALDAEADRQIAHLHEVQALFLGNMASIKIAEAEFPGLFSDKKSISLKPAELVEVEIAKRTAEFRLALREKEDLDKAEADKAAELKAAEERTAVEATKAAEIPVVTLVQEPVTAEEIPPFEELPATVEAVPVFEESPATVEAVPDFDEAVGALTGVNAIPATVEEIPPFEATSQIQDPEAYYIVLKVEGTRKYAEDMAGYIKGAFKGVVSAGVAMSPIPEECFAKVLEIPGC